MKLSGLFGSGRGRLGSSVFAVTNGVQIVRQYQPVVNNPSTILQTNQRSKFKLISQIAAAVSPVIAYTREGAVSPRNRFISENIGAVSVVDDTAQVDVTKLQLTAGTRTAPVITAVTSKASGVDVELTGSFSGSVPDAAVCALFDVDTDGKMSLITDKVLTAGFDYVEFQATAPHRALVAYYAYYATSDAAKAKYGDYSIATAQELAKLISSRTLDATGRALTKTSWKFATTSA